MVGPPRWKTNEIDSSSVAGDQVGDDVHVMQALCVCVCGSVGVVGGVGVCACVRVLYTVLRTLTQVFICPSLLARERPLAIGGAGADCACPSSTRPQRGLC